MPDEKPKPGDKCPNCEGRGYVGDGTVRVWHVEDGVGHLVLNRPEAANAIDLPDRKSVV